MKKKTLIDLIEEICEYIDKHNGVKKIIIEGEKTNIIINKNHAEPHKSIS